MNYGLANILRLKKEEDLLKMLSSPKEFHVDDGLVSVSTEAEAIALVMEAKKLCSTGNLELHKFISNNKNVISSTL